MLKRLTDSDCLLIVEDYLGGNQTKYGVCKKYGICMGSISHWRRKFGFEDKIEETMKEKQLGSAGSPSDLAMNQQEELQRLRQQNRTLKARLKREALGHQAHKMLVDLAEETYGIEIKKLRSQVVERFTQEEVKGFVDPLCKPCEETTLSTVNFFQYTSPF